jgi:hypothetical protein
MVDTNRTLLEQINDGLKNKIVFWLDGTEVYYGRIVQIHKGGFVICTQRDLPEILRNKRFTEQAIIAVDIEKVHMPIHDAVMSEN